MESPSSVTLKELMYDVDVLLDGPEQLSPELRGDEAHSGTRSPGGEEAATQKLSRTPAKKWWHVPDDKIEDLIRESMDLPLSEYVGGSSSRQMGRSPSSSSVSAASAVGQPRALSRAGGSMVGGRSSSTSALSRRKDGKVSVKIFIPECGDTLVLRLNPGTRIGPPKELPRNRFTDIFGEDARSPTASRATAQQESLKEIIQGYSTIEVFRQRLSFKKIPMSNDDLTVEAYGIKDGDVINLGILKTGCGERNRPGSVTEAAECLRRHGSLCTKRGEGDAWLIPKWVSQERPNLLGTAKRGRMGLADFNQCAIYLPDMQDKALSRVRVAVTGSQTYT